MPGAGGLLVAKYLQTTAARDGTEFGELEHGTAFAPLLTSAGVSFDPLALGWLGSMEQFTPIVAVWHTVPVYSLRPPEDTDQRWYIGSRFDDIGVPAISQCDPWYQDKGDRRVSRDAGLQLSNRAW